MESTLREYKSPRKRFCRQHLATLATLTILRSFVPDGDILQTNAGLRSFLTFTSTSLHRSQRNTNLVFPLPLGTFAYNLVIVVTDRHTDTHTHTHKPTPVETYSLAFAGITIDVNMGAIVITRSANAERPRDALCYLNSCRSTEGHSSRDLESL